MSKQWKNLRAIMVTMLLVVSPVFAQDKGFYFGDSKTMHTNFHKKMEVCFYEEGKKKWCHHDLAQFLIDLEKRIEKLEKRKIK